MLNNENWLAHTELFKKHWVVETKSWVRSLGWFTDFMDTTIAAQGWTLGGDKDFSVNEYIEVLNLPNAEKLLYRCIDGITWEHIVGPIIFVVRKNNEQVFVAGWAGDSKTLNKYKRISEDPWKWPEKIVIEVDPAVAVHLPKKTQDKKESPIPVFFVSNGETNADENWKHLIKICPRAIRVDGIDGRRKMFHRCVDLSDNASHFFVVTGKNYVTDVSVFDFPVNSAPRSHIVFHAKNMSNRLAYGHMGIVCYNSELVLNTPEDFGLDFTEYSPIQTIPRTVSEARFATSPFEAWRTAFRETVKLTLKETIDSDHWLTRWLCFAEGENSEYVLKGAREGHEFALQHRDNKEELKNTVNWNWLEEYFQR